jgi:hypothetical protein
MRRRVLHTIVAAAMVLTCLQSPSLASAQARAQAQGQRPAAPAAPAPPATRLPNGHPDLSGVWMGGGGVAARNLKPGDQILLTPEAKKIMEARLSKDDPEANCLPTGVPRMNPYPWRMVQTPTHKPETHILIVFEGNIHSYRQIFMDGRPHPKDPDPTWYGHSIGRWEGDTLVVDTIGYNDKFWFDFDGHPHTTQLHTIERFTRTDLNTLSWDITIIDPGSYEKPFTVQTKARFEPSWELMEYICQENNTNVPHIQGPAKAQ